jgi:hypothetical protein
MEIKLIRIDPDVKAPQTSIWVRFPRFTRSRWNVMRSTFGIYCIVWLLLAASTTAALAKDELIIGAAQFPPNLHPQIGGTIIRSYTLGFALRPITAFNKDWQKVCLLCAELPTIENGLARYEDLPDGQRGLAVTIKLRLDLRWGDGEPVTARDLAFTWSDRRSCASACRLISETARPARERHIGHRYSGRNRCRPARHAQEHLVSCVGLRFDAG